MKPFLTLGDRVLILMLSAATLGSLLMIHRKPGTTVEIQSSAGIRRYPLNNEQTIVVAGPLGQSVVRIGKGRVWMETSPCPEQICLRMGSISMSGTSIVCLPNKIHIRIDSQDQPQWDAVTE